VPATDHGPHEGSSSPAEDAGVPDQQAAIRRQLDDEELESELEQAPDAQETG
jgi:hypothetical protein